jgi:hypothetical protein
MHITSSTINSSVLGKHKERITNISGSDLEVVTEGVKFLQISLLPLTTKKVNG